MEERAHIEERLRAYIHPNTAETAEQQKAFALAVDAQLEYEGGGSAGEIPSGVQSYSIGNYSVTFSGSAGGEDTQATICPAAWAILFNAGLLARKLPVARRL